MKQKKGQITVFILLGIIILILFGIILYINGLQDQESRSQIKRGPSEAHEINSIKYFVYSCLDRASIKGLRMVGTQGGYVYKGQEGSKMIFTMPKYEYDDGTQINNISYLILSETEGTPEPIKTIGGRIRNDPITARDNYYPCLTGYTGANAIVMQYLMDDLCFEAYNYTLEGNYGLLQYLKFGILSNDADSTHGLEPNLCKQNYNFDAQNTAGEFTCDCNFPTGTNPLDDEDCNFSLQAQLEYYITNLTYQCLNFSEFIGYNVTYGIPNVTAGINYDDVGISISLPITVEYTDGAPRTFLNTFYSLYNVRLKTLHSLLYGGTIKTAPAVLRNIQGILVDESEEIVYDILNDGNAFINSLGLSQITIEEADWTPKATVYYLNDTKSEIGGRHYVYKFVVQNRAPALDYYDESGLTNYHIDVPEGQDIVIEPVGVDPDGDHIIYEYKGWKQDWDDYWDDTTNSQIKGVTPFSGTYNHNKWMSSPVWDDTCVHPVYSPASNNRCANVSTNHSDIGEHNITILIKDTDGKPDWQTLNILVDDYPLVIFDTENYYDDIDNSKASIEDNYLVDVSRSVDFFPALLPLEFSWNMVTNSTLLHPSFSIPSATNIVHTFPCKGILPCSGSGIVSLNHRFDYKPLFTLHKLRSDIFTIQDLIVTAEKNGLTTNSQLNINVTRCLPHRNNSASYPWNEGTFHNLENVYESSGKYAFKPTDPFQANHTCCESGDHSLTPGRSCYELVDYGPINIVDNSGTTSAVITDSNHNQIIAGANTSIISITPNIPGHANIDNFGIWRREYNVYCTSDSGNTCMPEGSLPGGNERHQITFVSDCSAAGKDVACRLAVYGDTAQCRDLPTGYAIDDTTNTVHTGICQTDKICVDNIPTNPAVPYPGMPVSPDPTGTCSGGDCWLCQLTCNGVGVCNQAYFCTPCATNCDHTNPMAPICVN